MKLFILFFSVMTAVTHGQPKVEIERLPYFIPAQRPPPQRPIAKTTDTLSLELQVSLLPETTNTINFKASLTNTGTEPVVLSHTYTGHGEGRGSYLDYFKKNPFRLVTEPPVYHPTFGTVSPLPVKKNIVTHVLGAGEIITTEWLGECGKLYVMEHNSPWLTEPGRYKITAHFSTAVAGEENVYYSLVSNPAALDFGRSAKRPAVTLTTVTEVDTRTRELVVDAGSDDGVQVGQHWKTSYGKGSWDVIVTSVEPRSARMELSENGLGSKEEAFATGLNSIRDWQLRAGNRVWRADTSKAPDCGSEDAKVAGWHEKFGPGEMLANIRSLIASQGEWVIAGLVLVLVVMRALKMRRRVAKAK